MGGADAAGVREFTFMTREVGLRKLPPDITECRVLRAARSNSRARATSVTAVPGRTSDPDDATRK